MRFDTTPHTLYWGIDRHVDWMYCCVIDAKGEGRVHQHMRPTPQAFLHAVPPCREEVVVGVEGLGPWDWRAELGADEGLPFVLGHARYRRAIHGGTATNDRLDAHQRAALRRGGLLPQADVDPRRMRATRALWRRRHPRRHTPAEVDAPIQHTGRPSHRGAPVGRMAKPQNRRGLLARGEHAGVQQTIAVDLALVACDEPLRAAVARDLEPTAHRHAPVAVARWRPIPGVGNILALVRRYASEQIARFPRGQACVSDARLVKRAKASHGQRHGTRGKKIGHAQLTWAFSAAAGRFLKPTEAAQKSLATLATTPGTGQALASLAPTRGRAVSCRLTHHLACDQATCRALEGWRARTRRAAHGRPRGQRHPPCAPHRALLRVGHEPAPTVPGPHGHPGILWR
jgi:hypothetical protein